MPSHFNVNKVMLIGRLGADPELRYTSTGQPKCSMSIATSYRYPDKQKEGSWTEKTSWHRVVAWGKQGELCKEYLGRGRLVFVEGRLENRRYTAKDGQQKHVHEVITDNVVFIDKRKGDSSQPGLAADRPAVDPAVGAEPSSVAEDSMEEEELPF